MKGRIRLIYHETEEHVVVASGDPVVLDVFQQDGVYLSFYWRDKTPYTISLPLVSEALKKHLYPEKSA